MLAETRYEYILSQLKENGSIVVADISEKLKVSIETVRRDLILLETHGKLKRVFGGAVEVGQINHLKSFESRLDSNRELKAEVAETAISFIDDNDTVAIESGSTAVELAKALMKTDLNITIITHSNTVFNILKSKFKVVLIGGEYMQEDDCFGGVLTEDFLKKFHVNKAFLFPSALSIDNGIESFFLPVVPIERIFMDIADKVIVAADSEKFGLRATFKVMDLDSECIYVTDSAVSNAVKQSFADNDLVLVAGERENADAE